MFPNQRRGKMGRGKIEIKRIENSSNRQVTYSKRRNGIMKKAKEITVLCDAKVSLIIFGTSGKMHEYCSPSTNLGDILDQYQKTSGKKLWDAKHENLSNEIDRIKKENDNMQIELRHLKGEDINSLPYKELMAIEDALENGLTYMDVLDQTWKNRKHMKDSELSTDPIGQNLIKLISNLCFSVFMFSVLIFTVIAITYQPPDPWLESVPALTKFFTQTENATFKNDDSVLKTGEDLLAVAASTVPPALAINPITETVIEKSEEKISNLSLKSDCEDLGAVNCSDPRVLLSVERFNLKTFKFIVFLEYQTPSQQEMAYENAREQMNGGYQQAQDYNSQMPMTFQVQPMQPNLQERK
ncbi:hypothetical protein GQ457_01G012550 [Hibiscus cannabinus]